MIDPPQAWIRLYGRALLPITRSALRLLSEAELTAIVAHEVAHEYVDSEYRAARATGNSPELEPSEPTCDALAVAMLKHAGLEWNLRSQGSKRWRGMTWSVLGHPSTTKLPDNKRAAETHRPGFTHSVTLNAASRQAAELDMNAIAIVYILQRPHYRRVVDAPPADSFPTTREKSVTRGQSRVVAPAFTDVSARY